MGTSRGVICGHGRQIKYLEKLKSGGMPISTFLFSGPARVGKKTIALNFARGLFCTEQFDVFGCGSCVQCASVSAIRHPDLHILQGEESIGIEDVRELRRRLGLHAYSGTWRVVLIDDAERLTHEAQSALLKILEEPARGILFFLITAEPLLLLETIRSRTLALAFGFVGAEELSRWHDLQYPEVKGAKNILGLCEGRPGAAKRLMENDASAREEKARVAKLNSLLRRDLADQFLFADTVLAKGSADAKDFLIFLITRLRGKFFDESCDKQKLIAGMKAVLDSYWRLETTNANRRLLIDSALLGVRGI